MFCNRHSITDAFCEVSLLDADNTKYFLQQTKRIDDTKNPECKTRKKNNDCFFLLKILKKIFDFSKILFAFQFEFVLKGNETVVVTADLSIHKQLRVEGRLFNSILNKLKNIFSRKKNSISFFFLLFFQIQFFKLFNFEIIKMIK